MFKFMIQWVLFLFPKDLVWITTQKAKIPPHTETHYKCYYRELLRCGDVWLRLQIKCCPNSILDIIAPFDILLHHTQLSSITKDDVPMVWGMYGDIDTVTSWSFNYKARNLSVCPLHILRTIHPIYFKRGGFIARDPRTIGCEFVKCWIWCNLETWTLLTLINFE